MPNKLDNALTKVNSSSELRIDQSSKTTVPALQAPKTQAPLDGKALLNGSIISMKQYLQMSNVENYTRQN